MSEIPRWIINGSPLCAQADPELWFADDHERGKQARAIAICNQCDLKVDCLEYGMENYVQGIWGGLLEAERAAIRTKTGARAKSMRPTRGLLNISRR